MFTKTARTPQRESQKYRQRREGGGGGGRKEGRNEGNKDGIKFNFHSFTQAAPAEQGDEPVFEEEAGSDWNIKKRTTRDANLEVRVTV